MNTYLQSFDTDWFKGRLTVTMFLVIAVFLVLILRVFYLQIIEGEKYRQLSQNNCIRLQAINAPRGVIYDRNGMLLVDNRPSFNLSIVLKDARPVEETVRKLAAYTGIPEEGFLETIAQEKATTPSYKPILLQQDIGRDILASVEVHQFDLPGVVVDSQPRRHYMHGNAAHVIGYLGEISPAELKSGQYPDARGGEFVGKFGVEKTAESVLRGKDGGRQVEVNAKGQVIQILKTVAATPGHNIHLTIDHDLQKTTEELLKDKVGAAVALSVDTGEILALASSPAFDQNVFVNGLSQDIWDGLISNPFRPMENKVIQGEYPPASTYKIVTALAGLQEGVIDENTTFFCPGYYRFGDRTFRCWRRGGHGTVKVVEALAVSCDVYFYQVGQRLGVDRLAEYARACGLGAPTSVQMGHESGGLIPTSEWKRRRFKVPWQKGETLSIAIGQGYNLVTPLQMAVLVSAVANGGTLYQPMILKSIAEAGSDTIHETDPVPVGQLPVSPENLELVRKGLWEVVNGKRGTARLARVEGIEILGKTGTAQIVSRKKNDQAWEKKLADHHKPHAWFVAYGKRENIGIGVAVIVEHGEHGSRTAAPIARDIIKAYLMEKDEHEAVAVQQ